MRPQLTFRRPRSLARQAVRTYGVTHQDINFGTSLLLNQAARGLQSHAARTPEKRRREGGQGKKGEDEPGLLPSWALME